MASRAQLHDGSALVDLQSALAAFRDQAHEVINASDKAIAQTRAWLEERARYWEREVARCESDYYTCLAWRDEDGYGRDCSSEAAALERAQQALENVRRWQLQVDNAGAAYSSAASKFGDVIGTDLTRASAWLGYKLRTVDEYGAVGAGLTPPSTPSKQDHGYSFEKAKQEMLRREVNNPNLGSAERGWIKQELNRIQRGEATRLRMPPGFDAGHRVPGLNTASNLRLEPSSINRARPHIAKRLGLDWIYR